MLRLNQHAVKKMLLCLIMFLFIGITISSNLFAQRASAPAQLVRSATMTIDGKTNDAVISNERRFVVTTSTVIFDAGGRRLDLAALTIPSDVELTYQLRMDQAPLCLKIVIK